MSVQRGTDNRSRAHAAARTPPKPNSSPPSQQSAQSSTPSRPGQPPHASQPAPSKRPQSSPIAGRSPPAIRAPPESQLPPESQSPPAGQPPHLQSGPATPSPESKREIRHRKHFYDSLTGVIMQYVDSESLSRCPCALIESVPLVGLRSELDSENLVGGELPEAEGSQAEAERSGDGGGGGTSVDDAAEFSQDGATEGSDAGK